VAESRSAGVGSSVTLRVGGKFTPAEQPVEIEVRVRSLTDGRFVMRGPYQAGQASSLGETAIVAGPLTLLLTSRAGLTQDPEAFASQGIDLLAQDLIVAKSGYHFKINFAGVATPLVVDTPGLTNWRPGLFHYVHARPFYPEDDVALDTIESKAFPD